MEPMGIVWNWMITVYGLLLYFKLAKATAPPLRRWKLFFLFLGISAFFGALGHGLFHYWGMAGKIAPWTLGVVSTYFAEVGMYSFITDNDKLRKRLRLFSLVKVLVVFAGLAFVSFDFNWVKINSVIGLTIIVGGGGYLLSRRIPELIYLPAGVLVLSSAALVHGFDINPHRWFNRDDLAHLIMIGGMSLFYVALSRYRLAKSGS